MTKETKKSPLSALQNEDKTHVSPLEMTSIQALMVYAAHNHHIGEETVRAMVAAHFGVEDIAKLPNSAYDDVIRYLVDLHVDMILN